MPVGGVGPSGSRSRSLAVFILTFTRVPSYTTKEDERWFTSSTGISLSRENVSNEFQNEVKMRRKEKQHSYGMICGNEIVE